MLIEVSAKEFHHRFNSDPHPFLSAQFIELNKEKVDKIVRLVEDNEKVSIGLIAGIKDGVFNTSFSAPFGGFHYRNENIYIGMIEQFLEYLKLYLKNNNIQKACLSLPPAIYQESFNAKIVNLFIRLGFILELPEITNWIDLNNFKGQFSHRSSREHYNQAVRNNLSFKYLSDINEKRAAFDLIKQNRARFNRPIHMDLADIINTGELWPVDFFSVTNSEGIILSSGIFYQFPGNIAYAVFWGDNEEGRPLRAMDFLIYNLITYYKSAGFLYIDLGISTESGMPNEGLLRFKETHEATSSLRYSFTWNA